ncbi:MAG TPA: HisA/HisF-related TIM barrel protein, partial [Gemmatimonadales bacterium]|nr:HisA/HisF-related TIM barrel protein [Gemmatimonadales bacterium]
LHVVDLDAALGRGDNSVIVSAILDLPGLAVSVGGGVRTTEQIGRLIDAGADRVVVGTRAIEDSDWLEQAAAQFPGRLVVAADVRERQVVTRGWASGSGQGIGAVLDRLGALPLAGVLVTAVHQEGRLSGPDLALIADCLAGTTLPVVASGGITTMEDLRVLGQAGAAAAVLGMALYTGSLDPDTVAREFAA